MNQKGLAPILIVLILAALVGGYLVYQKQTKPTPSPQPTTQPSPSPAPTGAGETTNWKTYTNTKFGYSLKYPSDVLLEEELGGFVFIDKQIYVDVTNSDPEQCRGDCPVIQKKEKVSINGISSKKLIGYIGVVGGSIPQSYQTITIPHNNKFYTFTVYELKYDDDQPLNREIGSVPDTKVNLFNQILSTFRFLD